MLNLTSPEARFWRVRTHRRSLSILVLRQPALWECDTPLVVHVCSYLASSCCLAEHGLSL